MASSFTESIYNLNKEALSSLTTSSVLEKDLRKSQIIVNAFLKKLSEPNEFIDKIIEKDNLIKAREKAESRALKILANHTDVAIEQRKVEQRIIQSNAWNEKHRFKTTQVPKSYSDFWGIAGEAFQSEDFKPVAFTEHDKLIHSHRMLERSGVIDADRIARKQSDENSLDKARYLSQAIGEHRYKSLERSGVIEADRIAHKQSDEQTLEQERTKAQLRGEVAYRKNHLKDVEVSGAIIADRIADKKSTNSALERGRDRSQEAGEPGYKWNSEILGKAKDIHMKRVIMSAMQRRQNQQDVTKGIEGAFGKGGLKAFLKGMGIVVGATTAGRIAKFLAYGNTLNQAKIAQQFGIASAFTGTNAYDLSSYAYALRPYGGGIGEAGSFFQRINRFVQGSLVGKGLDSFGEAALQYGLDISGTGPAGLATKDELIERISNRLVKMDDREKADFAESLRMDKASFMLMKDGFVKYKERIQYAESGNPFQFGNKDLEETQESIGKLSAEWDKFWMNVAGTDIVKGTTSVLTTILHDMNKGMSVGRGKKNASTSYEFYKNLDESGMLHKYVSNYIRGSSWKENNGLIDYLNQTGQLRSFVENHDFGALGGGVRNWVLSQESHGLTPYQQSLPIALPQPTIQIDLGNINVSQEAKQELQQIVYPWLETNVITPMIRSTK